MRSDDHAESLRSRVSDPGFSAPMLVSRLAHRSQANQPRRRATAQAARRHAAARDGMRHAAALGCSKHNIAYLLPAARRRLAETLDRLDLL